MQLLVGVFLLWLIFGGSGRKKSSKGGGGKGSVINRGSETKPDARQEGRQEGRQEERPDNDMPRGGGTVNRRPPMDRK